MNTIATPYPVVKLMGIFDIASYIIAKSDNVGDLITNKKLQKILYYIKAWGSVYFQPEGVITEPFEAWVHGPVCREVYNAYKIYGYHPLSVDYKGESSSEFISAFRARFAVSAREADKIDLIDAVFDEYAKHTSLHLEMLSHSERPWIEARQGLAPNQTGNVCISETTMREYYASKI